MMPTQQCSLSLENLKLSVKLGCEEQERAHRQTVTAQLTLSFPELSLAGHTDRIEDTVCYANLAGLAQEFCKDQSFHLLEALGFQLHQFLKRHLPATLKLSLSVSKTAPVQDLDHAVFIISD